MIAATLRLLVRGYQLTVSPLLGPRCRFAPSCSEYAMEALTRHGAVAGTWLALKRVARCHPFGGHGYDPVPGTATNLDLKHAARASGSHEHS